MSLRTVALTFAFGLSVAGCKDTSRRSAEGEPGVAAEPSPAPSPAAGTGAPSPSPSKGEPGVAAATGATGAKTATAAR